MSEICGWALNWSQGLRYQNMRGAFRLLGPAIMKHNNAPTILDNIYAAY